MDVVITVLTALGPVIAAAIDAAQRGGDWRKAAREALDAAEKADKGLAAPRADAIEQRHRERLERADEPTREVPLHPTIKPRIDAAKLLEPIGGSGPWVPRIDFGDDEG